MIAIVEGADTGATVSLWNATCFEGFFYKITKIRMLVYQSGNERFANGMKQRNSVRIKLSEISVLRDTNGHG